MQHYERLPRELSWPPPQVLNSGPPYPAGCGRLLSELRGTLAYILVPPWGCESIENSPCTSFSRSRILVRPSPLPCIATLGSKPIPESHTVRWIAPDVPNSSTSKCRSPLCFAELNNASCSTRKRGREISSGRLLGTSWLLK